MNRVFGTRTHFLLFGINTASLRALKNLGRADAEGSEAHREAELAVVRAFVHQAIDRVDTEARRALARIAEGDTLRIQLSVLRRFLKHSPPDTIELKRVVANRAIELERYPFTTVS